MKYFYRWYNESTVVAWSITEDNMTSQILKFTRDEWDSFKMNTFALGIRWTWKE